MNGIVGIKLKNLASGLREFLRGTDGAAHTYGLARNGIEQGPGTYAVTEIKGFWVVAQPTDDLTDMTFIDAGSPVSDIAKEAFTEGQFYPCHLSTITVGAGGNFILVI